MILRPAIKAKADEMAAVILTLCEMLMADGKEADLDIVFHIAAQAADLSALVYNEGGSPHKVPLSLEDVLRGRIPTVGYKVKEVIDGLLECVQAGPSVSIQKRTAAVKAARIVLASTVGWKSVEPKRTEVREAPLPERKKVAK